MIRELDYVGSLLFSGNIAAADPCYGPEDSDLLVNSEIIPGEYACYFKRESRERWALVCKNTNDLLDPRDPITSDMIPCEEIGVIGIDSGLAMIMDGAQHSDINSDKISHSEFYRDVCAGAPMWDTAVDHNYNYVVAGTDDGVCRVCVDRTADGHVNAAALCYGC